MGSGTNESSVVLLVQFPFTDVRAFLDQNQAQVLPRPDWQNSSTWSPVSPPKREAFVRWLGAANPPDGDEFGWCSAARLVRLPPPGRLPSTLSNFRIEERLLSFNGRGAVRLEVAVGSADGRLNSSGLARSFEDFARQLLALQFDVGVTGHGKTIKARLIDIGPQAAQAVISATTPTKPPIGYQPYDSWLTPGRQMIMVYYDAPQFAMLPSEAKELQISFKSRIRCHYAALTFESTRVGIWYIALGPESNSDEVRRFDLYLRRRHALRESLVGLCRGLKSFGTSVDERRLLDWLETGFGKLYDKQKQFGINQRELDEIAEIEARNISTLDDQDLDAIKDSVMGRPARLWQNVERLKPPPAGWAERGAAKDVFKALMTGLSMLIGSAALITIQVLLNQYAVRKPLTVTVPIRIVDGVLGVAAAAAFVVAVMVIWYGVGKRRKWFIPAVRRRLRELGWFGALFLIPGLLAAFTVPS
jgi:hypothetical protein